QALRLEAARGLLEVGGRSNEVLVQRVVKGLGADNLDDCIEAARSLKQLGVADELIRRVVAHLEDERPATCPECGVGLTGRDRPGHLMSAHGYVDVFGAVLPRPVALARLWDRVFTGGDTKAHDRICDLLIGVEDSGSSPRAAARGLEYAAA